MPQDQPPGALDASRGQDGGPETGQHGVGRGRRRVQRAAHEPAVGVGPEGEPVAGRGGLEARQDGAPARSAVGRRPVGDDAALPVPGGGRLGVGVQRFANGVNTSGQQNSSTRFMMQLTLKGLSTVDNGLVSAFRAGVPGYTPLPSAPPPMSRFSNYE